MPTTRNAKFWWNTLYLSTNYEIVWMRESEAPSERKKQMIETKKTMVTMIWKPLGFHEIDVFLKHKHILQPILEPCLQSGGRYLIIYRVSGKSLASHDPVERAQICECRFILHTCARQSVISNLSAFRYINCYDIIFVAKHTYVLLVIHFLKWRSKILSCNSTRKGYRQS
jgi:hypothetical protein